MKKSFSLLLTLTLMLSVIFCGLADKADSDKEILLDEAGSLNDQDSKSKTLPNTRWDDVVSELGALGLEGDFYALNGMDMAFWVPSFLIPDDIGLTYEETHALAAFHAEDNARSFIVSYYPLKVENIIEFAGVMDELGAEEIRLIIVNDLPACSFVYDNVFHVSFFVEGGYIFSFDFEPASNQEFRTTANFIVSSVQKIERK